MYNRYDSIHGVISISELAHQITQHRIFQRMNQICQLGSIQFIYRYANHTRFSHSIGTAYLARKFATVLSEKHVSITPLEILCVEIAGLCHDIGHGPFSHLFDKMLSEMKCENAHHEYRSIILTRHILQDLKYADLPIDYIELILYFIDTEKYTHMYNTDKLPQYTKGLEQIVNNAITLLDVDKLDYIERDRRALRLDHLQSTIDIDHLFEECQIIDDNLQFNVTSKETIDNVVYRRHMLYTEFYYSAKAKAVDRMLSDALQIANREFNFVECASLQSVDHYEEFTKMTDMYVVELVLNSKIPLASQLIRRIISNDLYRLIATVISTDESLVSTSFDLSLNKSAPGQLLPRMQYHLNTNAITTLPKLKIIETYDTRPNK